MKTTLLLPKPIYLELRRRATEEGRSMKDIIIEAILDYLTKSGEARRDELISLLLSPVEGAGPEDFTEYGYEDLGEEA